MCDIIPESQRLSAVGPARFPHDPPPPDLPEGRRWHTGLFQFGDMVLYGYAVIKTECPCDAEPML